MNSPTLLFRGVFQIGLLLLGFLAVANLSFATSYTVVPDESVFAVVTHRTGIGARLAHNHFVAPKEFTANVSLDGDDVTKTAFHISFPVTNLVPDDDVLKAKWMPTVVRLGILQEAQGPIKASDQASIREHMLEPGQLDAGKFPTFEAEVVRIEPKSTKVGATEFAFAVTVRVTLHGKKVERAFGANIEKKDGAMHIEAISKLRFTDFGITPYSAMLGSVRNEDEFDVFVSIVARPAEPAVPR